MLASLGDGLYSIDPSYQPVTGDTLSDSITLLRHPLYLRPVVIVQIIDRGIALRKNLGLPQSETASAIVHGLQAGEYYSFTVSCVAEVDGALRHVSLGILDKVAHPRPFNSGI